MVFLGGKFVYHRNVVMVTRSGIDCEQVSGNIHMNTVESILVWELLRHLHISIINPLRFIKDPR